MNGLIIIASTVLLSPIVLTRTSLRAIWLYQVYKLKAVQSKPSNANWFFNINPIALASLCQSERSGR